MKTPAILECVPNFSHGIHDDRLEQIISSINKIQNQKLLHVDSNLAANRTVMTFAGEPEAVVEAAFQAVKAAVHVIDMRSQKGAHPRIGAADVVPIVPLKNVTLVEAKRLAYFLSQRIANELQVPIYAYEHSAKQEYRRGLPQIRKGEYEGLEAKMRHPLWKPDFGPEWNDETKTSIAKTGATILGARNLLVAFNVSLNTKDAQIAVRIAERIRESGFWQHDPQTGRKRKVGGLLPHVRAIGWYISDFATAQVSTNLLDYRKTSPLIVWETVRALAKEYGCEAAACELIGLIPKACLVEAGTAVCPQGEIWPEEKLIQEGVRYLRLDTEKRFDPEVNILEYALKNANLL